MGYLYNESHNVRLWMNDFYVPDTTPPNVNTYTPDDLEISETKFFVRYLWYDKLYKSGKFVIIYHNLFEMSFVLSRSLVHLANPHGLFRSGRVCARRSVMYYDMFTTVLANIDQALEDAYFTIPDYLEHDQINTYDVISDWKSAVTTAIYTSIGLPPTFPSRIFTPITYGTDPIVRDNVACVMNGLIDFRYHHWQFAGIKAWNLYWDSCYLIHLSGSKMCGYIRKQIAYRNW